MDWKEYTKEALSTRKPESEGLTYTGLALAGEAGEFANEVKKMIRDDAGVVTPERHAKLCYELGDVLWYLTSAADILGTDLESIARLNIEKLRLRQTIKAAVMS